ncbi:MAG TPA: hypothetical protein PKX27_11610 [Bacteroidales bacterium]|nr:hypothetical protein [Bacteroidales bacterium]HOX74174.1 hypothetical protein [Bacteroidales bacterium]HPM88625.1 hypothetical protein [Bacteroidales bacterium]HQM70550.1 hypothetical protein [Bacteroidales bacterium]
MKRLLIFLSLVLGLSGFAAAQDYNTGIGFRGGLINGLTVKHFLSKKGAVEGLLASRYKGLEITGLYEVHNPIPKADRLKWYYGAGAHLGFYNGDNTKWDDDEGNYTSLGLDLILGLEYSFSEVPINLGLDWKPEFNLLGYSKFIGDGVALSVRFIF